MAGPPGKAGNPLYESRPRCAGILLHISSLPGPYGIGDLGGEARRFAGFLAAAGASLWQILPLGPTGYGNSPYAARSSFAGNELFLSPDALADRGLVTEAELAELRAAFAGPAPGHVDYGLVEARKLPLLKKAARRFLDAGAGDPGTDFAVFCGREQHWLDDYALFRTLCGRYGDARWHTVWDRAFARREQGALEKLRGENAAEILEWKVLQFFFETQWRDLKAYVNARGIRIIGDIPVFVAPDSADSWTHIDEFRTGPDGRYSFVSGVPPDYFSPTGQLWGNPVYDWEVMKGRDYVWWKARIRRLLSQVDIFRIDHFRGFDEYWAVPADYPTAEKGTWEKGPGRDFFESLKKDLGELPVLAEDLGFLTEGVKKLREDLGFPGMKICQFGFEDMKDGVLDGRHLFLPHNYGYPWAAYTGTHDNNTAAGWYAALSEGDKRTAAAYFNCGPGSGSPAPDGARGVPAGETALPEPADAAWGMIRAVMASHAEYAIFPLQDLLGLGAEARMNTPATCGPENWSWRLTENRFSALNAGTGASPVRRFRDLAALYGREGQAPG
ncbi:MAG: 4-alpha-glucanotransferase [Spirochaetaceae bacterium]|jgi:4-alpha-glucanotransferase|nr:4-alpha-glucanotransferase [Spirochaetaceae bacterium]